MIILKSCTNGENAVKYKVCQASFSGALILKSKIRSYSGNKLFKCGVGKARCSHPRTLKGLPESPIGEKTFQCRVCQARFRRSPLEKNHSSAMCVKQGLDVLEPRKDTWRPTVEESHPGVKSVTLCKFEATLKLHSWEKHSSVKCVNQASVSLGVWSNILEHTVE